ncbi:MAG: DUF502 domain-containing protein [Verrucomicrobia bacterium]|nr:DUF502 domain-containing protein [Verrucomicrobiota bacterium]
MKQVFGHWRASFLAGLAVVLPVVISLAIVRFLFGTVSNVTDTLLFFVPDHITHERDGAGPLYWYWSLAALGLAVALVTLLGQLARLYVGRKLIQLLDAFLGAVPLLNKIYGVVKQVNEAFSSSKKSSFKQVVLIEYPRRGSYVVAFLTSDDIVEASAKVGRKVVGVFLPTTPNPTTGFLLAVPDDEVIRLNMSVADGVRYIFSLGTFVPPYAPPTTGLPAPTPTSERELPLPAP